MNPRPDLLRRGAVPPAGVLPPLRPNLARRRRLVRGLYPHLAGFIGRESTPQLREELAGRLDFLLGLKLAGLQVLQASLEEALPEGPLSGEVLRGLAYRFIEPENRAHLLCGETVPLWTGRPEIWALARVVDTGYQQLKALRLFAATFRMFTGAVAGEVRQLLLPVNYARWLLKETGYPRRERAHELEMMNTQLWLRLGANAHGHVNVLGAHAHPSQRAWNGRLARSRIEKNCSQVKIACWQCGMGVDVCPRACRARTKNQEESCGR